MLAELREQSSYRGWAMAGVAFLCLIFVFGAPTAIMPMIYGPVMKEFGWTHSTATLATTFKNAMSTFVALFVLGPFLERFGLRALFIVSCVAVGAGMASFLLISGLTSYYVASATIGIGTATIMVAAKVLVSRWFISRIGLAIGLSATGTSIGGVIFPLAGSLLIQEFGWRVAVAVVSLGIWLIALPVYLVVARERPTEADIVPDAPRELRGDAAMQEKLRAADLDVSFGEILRMPSFWLLVGGVVLASGADAAVFQNTILYLQGDAGLSNGLAALSLSGTFALGVIAKLTAGIVFDRYSLAGVRFWYLLLAVSVLLAVPVTGLVTLIVFTVARGIAHGGLINEGAVVAKQCFGQRHLNQTLPIFVGAYSLGASLGPVLLSYVRDTTGSYRSGFLGAAVICVVAAVMLLGVKPIYWQNLRALRR
jgi:MFS transporter, OFA family, oxalate/formate antiporter